MSKSLRPDQKELHERIIGVSKTSYHKSYYPQLQQQISKLEKSEQKYRLLFENMSDGLVVCQAVKNIEQNTTDLKIIETNFSFEQITGFSKDEIREKPISLVFPSKTKIYKKSLKVLEQGKAFQFEEYAENIKKWLAINIFCPQPDHIAIIIHDITKEKNSELKLLDSLKEKDALVKEIHHRVKNNLQIISSLLHLQSKNIEIPEFIDFVTNSQNRVRALALVHEMLYNSENFSKINFSEFIKELSYLLATNLREGKQEVVFDFKVNKTFLDLDQAIPASLAVNEVIANALIHAFPADRKEINTISIHLEKNKKKIQFLIQDNGIGIDKNIESLESLGIKLVNVLVKSQLGGNLTISGNAGTTVMIEFEQRKDPASF